MFAVTVPPREYELAARLLAQVVDSDRSGRSRTALREAAHQLGTELGSGFRPDQDAARRDLDRQDVESVLAQHGYEPSRGE